MLLDDIIALAIDNQKPLTSLLRSCLLLAPKLKNERLKTWATQELNGYDSPEVMPDYRTIIAPARGNFVGPFHSQMLRRILPSAVMEKDHRWAAETVHLGQPISAYENMLKNKGQVISFPWDSNLVMYYQDKFFDDYVLTSAWQ